MKGYMLDWCTLLNLYCGWDGVHHFGDFDAPFHTGSAVANEVYYARELDNDGQLIQRKLSIEDLRRQYPLSILQASTPDEMGLLVKLASRLDDGEAEGLAIAACRGYTFCSDDSLVEKVITSERIQVKIISTAELLQIWAGTSAEKVEKMPSVIHRITKLGRFTPNKSSPHFEWWARQLNQPPPRSARVGASA